MGEVVCCQLFRNFRLWRICYTLVRGCGGNAPGFEDWGLAEGPHHCAAGLAGNIRMSPGLQNAIAIISPVAAIAAAVIALMRVLGRLDRRLDHIEISIHGRKPKSCTPNRFPIPYLKPN